MGVDVRWRGLSTWRRIYRDAHARPDQGPGHRVAGGDADPRANESACDGGAPRNGNGNRDEDRQFQSSHECSPRLHGFPVLASLLRGGVANGKRASPEDRQMSKYSDEQIAMAGQHAKTVLAVRAELSLTEELWGRIART